MKTGPSFRALQRGGLFPKAAMTGGVLLVVWFTGVPRCAFGQSRLRALSVACQTSTGSVAAAESLAQLRALAADTTGLPEAIATCQDKFDALQKQEKSQWEMAVAARDQHDCQTAQRLFRGLFQKRTAYQRQARDELNELLNCAESQVKQPPASAGSNADALNTLRQARGAFNIRNFVVAKSLAQSIASRPDQTGEDARSLIRSIESIEANDKRHRDALVAISLKQFDKACGLLKDIQTSDPSFAGLAEATARAGGCAGVAAEARLKLDYEKATQFLATAHYAAARNILKHIQAEDPNYRDVARLLKQAEEGSGKENQKSADQRIQDLQSSVEEEIRRGELTEAKTDLEAALKLRPGQKSLKDLEAQLDNSLKAEEELLISGMDSFYAGNYAQARRILGDYDGGRHPAKLLALSCFYAGAAEIAEYYLAGAKDESKRQEGMTLFRQALQHYPGFSPPWSALSPKIRAVYSEATGG